MPFRASALVESFGLNVHFRYPSYIEKFDVLKARIKELRVRYLRDGLENDPATFQRWASLGLKLDLIVEPRHFDVPEAHAMIVDQVGANRVAAIEGINEADGWFATQAPEWAQITRGHQAALFAKFRGDPTTARIPIYAPSVINASSATQVGDLSAVSDLGNFHRYPGSRHPETAGWGGVLNGVKYGKMEYGLVNMANVIAPGKPAVITESGYFTYGAGNRVSEDVMGKYFPRLLLHHLAAGIVRTYAYELFDESANKADNQSNFGLIRHDGSAKPAFIALRNLFTVLGDSAQAFTPQPLELVVTTQAVPTDFRFVLFQKSSGQYFLAYWLAKAAWDPIAFKPVAVPPQAFTLAGVKAAQWVCPRFNVKWEAAQAVPGGVELTATDHVRVARLTL